MGKTPRGTSSTTAIFFQPEKYMWGISGGGEQQRGLKCDTDVDVRVL